MVGPALLEPTVSKSKMPECDVLRRMYEEEKKSGLEIAEELGVTPWTVYTWLMRCRIPRRHRGRRPKSGAHFKG